QHPRGRPRSRRAQRPFRSHPGPGRRRAHAVIRSPRVRLGAVGYLNARPLVYGLESHPGFEVRYDIPSPRARLLHARATDVGLLPSIEYLRGPHAYMLVPGGGVTSKGPVASVAIFTRRDPRDIRTIAMGS